MIKIHDYEANIDVIMPILNDLITTVFPYIPKAIVGQVAKRYIAGVALSDGVRLVHELNNKTIMTTMDLLGEDVKNVAETEDVKMVFYRFFSPSKRIA